MLFHAPPQFEREADQVVRMKTGGGRAYTHVAAQAIFDQMAADPRVTVITAAMCQGNKLEKVRDAFPDRFFDTGICEGHAVAFAAGQAKVGLRPIVDIYSTFLQRSYDQIFQEVALQNLPVTFMLDRGGLAGPDGPTHHGVFDLGYLRVLPEHGRDGAGRRARPAADARLRAAARRPVRDPLPEGDGCRRSPASARPSNSARAKCSRWGDDGMIVCGGALLPACLEAAERSARRRASTSASSTPASSSRSTPRRSSRAVRECGFVVTVEEAALMGGFGSAVLEAAADAGVDASRVRRLGIPDHFVEHGERGELLADLGLDAAGIAAACRSLARSTPIVTEWPAMAQPTNERRAR